MGLARYWATFRDNGYDVMETLKDLNEQTLNLLDIKLAGHRSLLLRKVKEITA